MSDRVCVLCLDAFSAEVAGRCVALAFDVGESQPGNPLEFVWAGTGDVPDGGRWWRPKSPRWSATAAIVPQPVSEAIDSPADPFEDARPLREAAAAVQHLLDSVARPGNQQDAGRIHMILVAALANDKSTSRVIRILEAVSSLRKSGALVHSVSEHVVVAVGSLADSGADIGARRAVSAEGLLRLSQHLQSNDSQYCGAPVYVVGEERGPEQTHTSAAQVDVSAIAVLAIATDLRSSEGAAVFGYRRTGTGLVVGRNEINWSPKAPFLAVGAAVVVHARQSALRERAALSAADLLDLYADADPDGGTPPLPLEEVDQATEQRLDKCREAAWRGLRRVLPTIEESQTPWSWSAAENVAGRLLAVHWERLLPLYGRERFMRLPMEDWEQATEELLEHTAAALTTARGDLRDLGAVYIDAVHGAFGSILDEVGRDAYSEEIDFAPRAAFRRLVVRLAAQCDEALAEGQQRWLQKSHRDQREINWAEDQSKKKREALVESLRKVPGPVAVAARIPLAIAAGALLALGLPTLSWFPDAPIVRACVGAILGLGPPMLLLHRAYQAKRGLLAAVDDWIEAMRTHQQLNDESLVHEAAVSAIRILGEYCRWLLDPTLPEDFQPRALAPWAGEGLDRRPESGAASRQKSLATFSGELQRSAEGWRDLAALYREAAGTSSIVKPLPAPEDPAVELGLPSKSSARKPAKEDRERFRGFLAGLRNWLAARRERGEASAWDSWIPFAACEPPLEWTASVQLPPLEELGSEQVRRANPAAGFHAAMTAYAELSAPLVLDDLIASHYGVDRLQLPNAAHASKDLFRHLNEMSALTIPFVNARKVRGFGLTSSESDPLVASLGQWPSAVLSRNLAGFVRLLDGLSAEDVLYCGNEERPRSVLGRAYRAAMMSDKTSASAGARKETKE